MPIHDWSKVPAGIFHAFHHDWITELSRTLNRGMLPSDYYALPEQVPSKNADRFGPDMLTLQTSEHRSEQEANPGGLLTATKLKAPPQTQFVAESEGEYYRRKKSAVAIRHVSGDRLVAVLEVVSAGNKSGQAALETFVSKVCELLEQRLHLLVIDPIAPGKHDPQGVHAAVWEQWSGESFELPADQLLTLVAYECALTTTAYIEPYAMAEPLPDMPLFLQAGGCVMVPLEATYQAAYEELPARWRDVRET
jgi:hypothetical protein